MLEVQTIEAPRIPQPYTDYGPEEKAAAIVAIEANNGNVNLTATQLGIPERTLRYWNDHKERFRELGVQKRAMLDKLDVTTHLLIDSMPAKIADASLSQTATAYGILMDKSQLLKGLPTSINVDLERNELTIVLQSSLSNALEVSECIDVTPEE